MDAMVLQSLAELMTTLDCVDWLVSIGVSYSFATNQTTYNARDTTIHGIQTDHKSIPENTWYQLTKKVTKRDLNLR